MSNAPRALFLLYEEGHIEALERYWREHPAEKAGSLVVALDAGVEARLIEKGIAVSSGRNYIPQDTSRFMLAEKWTSALFESKMWEWFRYRDIGLSPVFFLPIQDYLIQLLYYSTTVQTILDAYPTAKQLLVFASLQTTPMRERTLVRKQIAAPAACARAVGLQRGIEVVVLGESLVEDTAEESLLTKVQRMMLEWGISIFNVAIALLRRKGGVRILAVDYWRHVAPIMEQLPHGELVLYDRGEALNAGVRTIWRYRVRLFHADAFSARSRRTERVIVQRAFEERWRILRAELPEYSYRGFSLRALLAEALDRIMFDAVPQTLLDIDNTFAMLHALAPDIILLRVSIGVQAHFVLLALVAKQCGIPSLELQHGLEYVGPGSYSNRKSAEYIAVYGRVMQDELAALGHPREKLPIVGSPLFDAYVNDAGTVEPKRHGSGISVLCITSNPETPWAGYDWYDLEKYFRSIAGALEKIPGSRAVIKLRPGQSSDSRYGDSIDRAFARVPHTIAEYEPLDELFAAADIVISYYSTTVLEALLCQKAVVVFSTQAMEKEIIHTHLQPYADAGGLMIAYTPKELESACRALAADKALRDSFAHRARKVLAQFNLFDGRASEHVVKCIGRLAQKQKNDFYRN